jgi:3-phosphoshikimate 1-carboxyvinyltransferase
LTHKESDRSASLQQEFGRMGVKVEVNDDVMIIHGGGKVNGAKVHSHHDHRIAMACAVAALKAEGQTEIEDADAVNKSYPDFFSDLRSLGADLNNPYSILNAL